MKISNLTPCGYNPRRISDGALELLAASIRQHTAALESWDPADGYRLASPITVNRCGNRIVGGHQRVIALQRLGQDWIHESDLHWIRLDPSGALERALNADLNSRDCQGEFDMAALAELARGVTDAGVPLAGFAEGSFEFLAPQISPSGPDGDEWYTPAVYVDAARELMGGIDLDPASCVEAQETVRATDYYTKLDDGLAQDWHGNVWLNPPYSVPLIQRFVDKLIAEVDAGRVVQAVLLVNNATDTKWCQRLLARFPACFVSPRIRFKSAAKAGKTSPRQGQVFFYLGPFEGFSDLFGQFGTVVHAVI